MRTLLSLAVGVVVAGLLSVEAAAQSITASRSVTHSPAIHRGNVSQSAVFVAPPVSNVHPGPIVTPHPGRGHGHGPGHGHGHGHGRHHGHGGHYRNPWAHVHSYACQFTAGHYATRYEQQYVPPRVIKQYVPPRYEWVVRRDGRQVKILVANGYYKDVVVDGHYTSVPVHVWVPASWSCGYYY